MLTREQIAELIGKRMAVQIAGNNQPDMSGDNRNRLHGARRRQYDEACLDLADEILAAITYPRR